MLLLKPPAPKQANYNLPPKQWRDFNALKATALDVGRFPILSKHWRGPLIVGGQLACNDDSGLARRFDTAPAPASITDNWQHVGAVSDRVLAAIPDKTKPEAA